MPSLHVLTCDAQVFQYATLDEEYAVIVPQCAITVHHGAVHDLYCCVHDWFQNEPLSTQFVHVLVCDIHAQVVGEVADTAEYAVTDDQLFTVVDQGVVQFAGTHEFQLITYQELQLVTLHAHHADDHVWDHAQSVMLQDLVFETHQDSSWNQELHL